MERPLFAPPVKPALNGRIEESGDESIAADALFEQVHVDKAKLKGRIRQALQTRDQITLSQILTDEPLQQGLAEVVAYLGIAADDATSVIDDRVSETVRWRDDRGVERQATIPLVIFGQVTTVEKSGRAA